MEPSAQDRELLGEAARLHRPLVKAAGRARSNGLSLLVFGLLTMAFTAIDFSLTALLLGALVAGVGWLEWRGADGLLRADPSLPPRLARNELVLFAGIAAYALLQLTLLRPEDSQLAGSGAGALGIDVAALTEGMTKAFYATVIAVSAIYQGGMALFFHRRAADVAAYRERVPDWAREIVESL